MSSQEMIVIDQDGQSLGVLSRDQALYLAYDSGVDLVEVSGKAVPPVTKLIDSGKYQYEIQKREAKQQAHQKTGELKEIRLGLKIDNHDFDTKAKKSQSFLDDGNKVRVTVVLRGRENIFPERGYAMIVRFVEKVGARIDQEPNKMGNRISATLVKQTHAKDKDI
ncbi:translation initiation factor IF-3 [Candidatus Berkelbacteria bacterium CG2_30_43_20]|nr:MAG: translation initiation factor IF-3 [Candidatus Berkelbacteria bacterium CG2_30_43_20]